MNQLNKYNILFIIAVVFLAAYFLFFLNINAQQEIPAEIKRIEFNGQFIYVETAKTVQEKSLGLGGRDSMLEDHGMLFVFEKKDLYVFWMKGMKFPLDIIWLNDDKVVGIVRNAQVIPPGVPLPRYTSGEPANYVLEVNAGLADKYGIKKGDRLIFK